MKKLTLVYFSPTKTTETVLKAIAQGLAQGLEISGSAMTSVNFTRPEIRQTGLAPFGGDDIVLLGAPVYAGRLPSDAADFFKKLSASGTPAILTVVYGNREYEDALLELKDIASACGFIPVSGAAFIGEHSFASTEIPVAMNRPDGTDLQQAQDFGSNTGGLLKETHDLKRIGGLKVPGNFPYRDGMGKGAPDFIEVTDMCTNCGICATVCPSEAIDAQKGYVTMAADCILCCACIKACPEHARVMKDGPIKDKAKWLNEACSTPKPPQVFFAPGS
ncbi:4Fe-4S binding protein [uncultured Desulfobacter sp.]|uniref:4Fe-4S binding protein n=1 Tax=uncultured Desulfobacter sp. TaxID=240139 RepID=UPI002AABC752|nr:4Fe-4S binding protein [uncultured Desulfobacter sp.]